MLEGKLIKLTYATPEDADDLHRWDNDPDLYALYSGDGFFPKARATFEEDLKSFNGNANAREFRIRTLAENRLIGKCHLFAIDWISRSAYLACMIGEKSDRRQGYGSEALRLLLDYGFNELNLHRLEAWCYSFNEGSYKTLKKHGFEEEGRKRESVFLNGKYSDQIFLSLLKREYEDLCKKRAWDFLHKVKEREKAEEPLAPYQKFAKEYGYAGEGK